MKQEAEWNRFIGKNFTKGSTASYKALPKIAVGPIGFGSSVTYTRYLDEDVAHGIWKFVKDEETNEEKMVYQGVPPSVT